MALLSQAKKSDDAICHDQYHTEFVSWRIDHLWNYLEICVETTRPTFLSLDASLPKHKKRDRKKYDVRIHRIFAFEGILPYLVFVGHFG